ncbi:hypothetical protein GQ457_11G029420 [Hibiscus cannabinus]
MDELHKAKPDATTHTATKNLPRLQLLYSIIHGRSIDIGKIMLEEAFANYYQKGRHGIMLVQILGLMGFNEDVATKASPGGSRTIVATRLAALTTMVGQTQAQLNELHSKMITFFRYFHDRNIAIQAYFLELLPDEAPLFPNFSNKLFQPNEPSPQDTHPDQLGSSATISKRAHALVPRPAPASIIALTHPKNTHTPHSLATTPAHASPIMPPISSKCTISRKEKGNEPLKPTPRPSMPEETVDLDSNEDDEDMPDATPPPAPIFDTSMPR